jgi:hypothetical protein
MGTPGSISGRLFPAIDRPFTGVVLGIILSPLNLSLLIIGVTFGWSWFAIIFAKFVSSIISFCVNMSYFHFKFQKLSLFHKGVVWQSYIVPLIIAALTIPCLQWLLDTYIISWIAWSPILMVSLIALFCLFGFSIFIYAPLYGFLGGFDDHTLQQFEEAITLAGPSKIIMKALWFMVKCGMKLSPFKNKFILPFFKEAEKERIELKNGP